MGAQLRVYRRRIRATQSTRKITKAMELIAASRIAKSQARINAARPYSTELTRALSALGTNASITHPLLTGIANPQRTAILVITSDRGLAGGYSSNAIKAANELAESVRAQGKEPVLFLIGRKAVSYYRFRAVPYLDAWTGFSEQPSFADAQTAATRLVSLLEVTSASEVEGIAGVDELYLVFTKFESMVTQTAQAVQLSPVSGIDLEEQEAQADTGPKPAYDFEPEAEQLLLTLLPRYISARIFAGLLDSAASESASRRRAMKSASDNASDLIELYTRLANQARQAEITQEISEIVGGADALASAGSD